MGWLCTYVPCPLDLLRTTHGRAFASLPHNKDLLKATERARPNRKLYKAELHLVLVKNKGHFVDHACTTAVNKELRGGE